MSNVNWLSGEVARSIKSYVLDRQCDDFDYWFWPDRLELTKHSWAVPVFICYADPDLYEKIDEVLGD